MVSFMSQQSAWVVKAETVFRESPGGLNHLESEF